MNEVVIHIQENHRPKYGIVQQAMLDYHRGKLRYKLYNLVTMATGTAKVSGSNQIQMYGFPMDPAVPSQTVFGSVGVELKR